MGLGAGASFLIPIVLLLIGIGVALGSWRRPILHLPRTDHGEALAVLTHTRSWRLGGLLLGVLGAIVCASLTTTALGRIVAFAPIVAAGGLVLGAILGELTATRRQGAVRSASLATRRLGDYISAGQRRAVAAGVLLLVSVLGFGTLRGSADDQGRAGRALARSCVRAVSGVGPSEVGSRRGPWPGSYYTVPLALGVVVLVLLAAVALRALVRRAALDTSSAALDVLARRVAAHNVLAACTAACLLIAGPLCLAMGSMLRAADECSSTGDAVTGWTLLLLGALAFGLGLGTLGRLLIGPKVVIEDVEPSPGDWPGARVPTR